MIKRNSKTILESLGIKKNKKNRRFSSSDFEYDAIAPFANYAPWLGDAGFMTLYEEVKNHTLVDMYRCYELWELTEKICKLDQHAHFLEVGVWRGGTAAIVAQKLASLNAGVSFYLADTFTGVVKTTGKDTFYSGGEHADTSQEVVEKLIAGKYSNCKILKGIFPDDTAQSINPEYKFGYCHIDVDVYESAMEIVDWIWDKMIVGGVIIFDDYGFHTCDGITKYVNEQKNSSGRIVIHNLNGHAVMIKLK